MFLLSLYDHRCWRFVAYLLRQFVRMFVILIKSHSCIPLFCLSSVFLFSFSQELVPDGTVFGKARLRGRTDTAASPGGRRATVYPVLQKDSLRQRAASLFSRFPVGASLPGET